MKIYSTRHGETQWNLENRIVGITDLPLTDRGIEQAAMLAENVKNIGDIDIIISSPMKRARQTAQFTADALGLSVITDERLREWDYGSFEGLDRYADGFYENKRQFGVKMKDGGESLLQLAHRVYSVLDEIIEKYSDKNVLIVSHGGVCRVIHTYFNDMTTDEYSSWFMGNCQLIEYNID
jgi:probable phosphoglycerate mutase